MSEKPTQMNKSEPAGSLYNGYQTALVVGGKVVTTTDAGNETNFTPPDGAYDWRPVVYADSETFDASKHYRTGYVERVELGCVVRTFQIVPKSQEAF